MKARAILCPHQPPIRGDNTVSLAQGGTVTPGATKQLLPLVKLYILYSKHLILLSLAITLNYKNSKYVTKIIQYILY